MVDITKKSTTLRIATAQAIVRVSKSGTIQAIENRTVPKGDVFEMSRAAGLLGVKKTPDLLPDCHPLPIEGTRIWYDINGLDITVNIEVKTIYKTGVEVEAMHGASVVALNMYDMLKPIDKGVEIYHIKLLEKSGGKSSFKKPKPETLSAGIIVCSDRVSQGIYPDKGGAIIQKRLQEFGVQTEGIIIVPDEIEEIQNAVREQAKLKDFIILTGGTGLSPRDVTPEAILPLLEKRLIGVEETFRNYGQTRMPYAMLSRSLAGSIGNCLILALPGSSGGVEDGMDSLLPHVFHAVHILNGGKH